MDIEAIKRELEAFQNDGPSRAEQLARVNAALDALVAAAQTAPEIVVELPDGDEREVAYWWQEMRDGKWVVSISVDAAAPVAAAAPTAPNCRYCQDSGEMMMGDCSIEPCDMCLPAQAEPMTGAKLAEYMTYAGMGIQFLPVNHKVPHGDQCAYTLGSVPLYKLADVVNDAMKRPAPAPAQAEPIAELTGSQIVAIWRDCGYADTDGNAIKFARAVLAATPKR